MLMVYLWVMLIPKKSNLSRNYWPLFVLALLRRVSLLGTRSDLKEIMAVSDVVVSCSTDPEAF